MMDYWIHSGGADIADVLIRFEVCPAPTDGSESTTPGFGRCFWNPLFNDAPERFISNRKVLSPMVELISGWPACCHPPPTTSRFFKDLNLETVLAQ
jgi:hypothetical protein